MAWSQVGECQKIVEKLISAKVRIMPASADIQRRARLPDRVGCARGGARRLRLMTMSAVTETKTPCMRPNTRKLSVRPCHKPMMSMFKHDA